ncbi:MAG: hypothetical protein UEB85_00165 [Acutalibacteraceae bacterium]|jgi:hypothetical protein|nr:hypothetical protein [Acutalibacteraceae bacterium]
MGIIAKMPAPVNRYWQKGENMAQPREMQPPVAKIFSNVKQSMLPQPTKMGMMRVSSGKARDTNTVSKIPQRISAIQFEKTVTKGDAQV